MSHINPFSLTETPPGCGSLANEKSRSQTKPGACKPSTRTAQGRPLGRWGRSNEAMPTLTSAPWLKWSFPAGCCASGWAKGKRFSVLTCLAGTGSVGSVSRRTRTISNSQCGPHLVASISSRAVARICNCFWDVQER